MVDTAYALAMKVAAYIYCRIAIGHALMIGVDSLTLSPPWLPEYGTALEYRR